MCYKDLLNINIKEFIYETISHVKSYYIVYSLLFIYCFRFKEEKKKIFFPNILIIVYKQNKSLKA